LFLVVSGATAARSAGADEAFRRMARAAGEPEPLIRIGLEAEHRLVLSAAGGLRVLDPETGKDVWQPVYEGELAFVAEGGPAGTVPAVFRIQVSAFGDRDAAERERRRLADRYGVPAVVRHDPDRGNWRVRLGEQDERLALGPLMERLRADGITDMWIAEEPRETASGVTLRLVDRSYRSRATGLTRLAVLPRGRGRVALGERSYRGVLELRVTAFGTVRAINWVGLERYLLGVVPAELGPEVWPELEALKAQAVAARTYAWRNMGQFADEGFDQCATPRCQVYHGATAEHPLSDRAVAATRGEVLVWEGRPINAYFTATCGGHTENVESVFIGETAPYLRGVPCRAEDTALASFRGTVSGRAPEPSTDDTGADITRARALLVTAGVVSGTETAEANLARPLDAATLRRWTAALAALAGRPEPNGAPGGVETLGAAVLQLLRDLGWDRRADVLLSEADLPAVLRDPAADALDPEQRRALGYLVSIDGLRPFPDGAFHVDAPPSRARLLPALVSAGEAYRAFGLREATVSRIRGRRITLVQGKGERKLELAALPTLFRAAGGKPAPTSSLELWPGDSVRYRTDAAGRIDFLEVVPPVQGVADDRSSRLYSWQERRTRRQLEKDINARVQIGTLQDLRVLSRGVSGRVDELEVIGTGGRSVIRGFDVRRLLGLRESLIVVEPQRDAGGRIEAVLFTGKGWGHGVGLCQVGAYGMALRGASYKEILGHYYRGARIGRTSAVRGGAR
jgi:stage II sporulation protein D